MKYFEPDKKNFKMLLVCLNKSVHYFCMKIILDLFNSHFSVIKLYSKNLVVSLLILILNLKTIFVYYEKVKGKFNENNEKIYY